MKESAYHERMEHHGLKHLEMRKHVLRKSLGHIERREALDKKMKTRVMKGY